MEQIIQYITLGLILVTAWKVFGVGNGRSRKLSKHRIVVLDTCALIDGRIVELVRSGFMPEQLVIPSFVIRELQGLADGSDSHKRERARYGLGVVRELQDSNQCDVRVDSSDFPLVAEVDDKLVALAKKLSAQLYTTDFNLGKVAAISGVTVLNVNELAQSMRPVVLPGERREVKIIQRGEGRDQGIGYLEDGTMVVVDRAYAAMGKTIAIEIDRTFQTVAGKMLFAHPAMEKKVGHKSTNHRAHQDTYKASVPKTRV